MKMSRRALLSPIALGAALLTTPAAAQTPSPLFLRYQGLIEGVSLEDGSAVQCSFSFVPAEGGGAVHSETQMVIVSGARFSATLGAAAGNPLSPSLFLNPLDLLVECDLDSEAPGVELSVQERVGQTPRAAVAERASSVEGPVVATSLSVGQGDSARPVVDILGNWVGNPVIPRHGDQALVVEGVWVGEVDAPRVSSPVFSGDTLTLTGDLEASSAHVGRVYLRELYYDAELGVPDTQLINEDLEWVAGVRASVASLGVAEAATLRVAGEASVAGPLTAVDITASGALSASSAHISGALSADEVTARALTHPERGPLLSSAGLLIAPLDPQDADADGFSDLVEVTLGSDLADPSSRPIDDNANGVPDAFEGGSALDEVFTSGYFATGSAAAFASDPQTGLPWLAAELSLSGEGLVTSAAVTVAVELTDDQGDPVSASGLTLTLRTPAGQTVILHSGEEAVVGSYSDAAPPSASWALLATSSVSGFWQLVAQTPVGVHARVSRFNMRLGYTSSTRVSVSADLDLGGARRVVNVATPVAGSDATTKTYVDERVQFALTTISALVNAAQQNLLSTLDVRYPARLNYRQRLFRPVSDAGQPYLNNDAALAGGVSPSQWLSDLTAGSLSLGDLGALLTERGQGGSSALFALSEHSFASAAANVFSVVHFEVENTTANAISWDVSLLASCDLPSSQPSSLSLNGVNQWSTTSATGDPSCQTPHSSTVTLTLPGLTKSDVVLVGAGGPRDASGVRALQLAITSGSLTLPAGLRFVASWAR